MLGSCADSHGPVHLECAPCADLTDDQADQAVERFCEANFGRISNKSGFLMVRSSIMTCPCQHACSECVAHLHCLLLPQWKQPPSELVCSAGAKGPLGHAVAGSPCEPVFARAGGQLVALGHHAVSVSAWCALVRHILTHHQQQSAECVGLQCWGLLSGLLPLRVCGQGIIRRVQEDGPDGGNVDLDILPRSVRYRLRDLLDDVRPPPRLCP